MQEVPAEQTTMEQLKAAELFIQQIIKRNLKTAVNVSMEKGAVKVTTHLLWAPEGSDATIINTDTSVTPLEEEQVVRRTIGF